MGFSKQQIINQMKTSGLVPLFTHENADHALQVLKASYEAGIRAFEFTNRRANSFEVFQHLIRNRNSFPDLMLGIGTVMDALTTKKFLDAGADFIISPVVKPEMAPVCHQYDKLWIPGCATMTEIVMAKDNGAEVMKIFPGSVLGPQFISAVLPIIPGLQLMVTGGVEPNVDNLRAWFKSGVMSVGMGSNLFTKKILEQQDWNELKKVIGNSLSMIQAIKSEK